MNVRDAAEYLTARGFACRPKTVRAMVKVGKLGCYRGPTGGGPMQFPAGELDRFLKEGLVTEGKPTEKKARIRKATPRPVALPRPAEIDWAERYREVKGK